MKLEWVIITFWSSGLDHQHLCMLKLIFFYLPWLLKSFWISRYFICDWDITLLISVHCYPLIILQVGLLTALIWGFTTTWIKYSWLQLLIILIHFCFWDAWFLWCMYIFRKYKPQYFNHFRKWSNGKNVILSITKMRSFRNKSP